MQCLMPLINETNLFLYSIIRDLKENYMYVQTYNTIFIEQIVTYKLLLFSNLLP